MNILPIPSIGAKKQRCLRPAVRTMRSLLNYFPIKIKSRSTMICMSSLSITVASHTVTKKKERLLAGAFLADALRAGSTGYWVLGRVPGMLQYSISPRPDILLPSYYSS